MPAPSSVESVANVLFNLIPDSDSAFVNLLTALPALIFIGLAGATDGIVGDALGSATDLGSNAFLDVT